MIAEFTGVAEADVSLHSSDLEDETETDVVATYRVWIGSGLDASRRAADMMADFDAPDAIEQFTTKLHKALDDANAIAIFAGSTIDGPRPSKGGTCWGDGDARYQSTDYLVTLGTVTSTSKDFNFGSLETALDSFSRRRPRRVTTTRPGARKTSDPHL